MWLPSIVKSWLRLCPLHLRVKKVGIDSLRTAMNQRLVSAVRDMKATLMSLGANNKCYLLRFKNYPRRAIPAAFWLACPPTPVCFTRLNSVSCYSTIINDLQLWRRVDSTHANLATQLTICLFEVAPENAFIHPVTIITNRGPTYPCYWSGSCY